MLRGRPYYSEIPLQIETMRLGFVAVAGAQLGYGHLSRCLSLARCARRHALESSFLLFGESEVRRRVEQEGFACTVWPLNTLSDTSGEIPYKWTAEVDVAIVDFAHPVVVRNINPTEYCLKYLRDTVGALWVIDALGEDTFVRQIPDMPADVVVTPYVGAVESQGASWKHLAGPEYAILAPDYADLPARKVRRNADRLFVSCGGSDPQGFSLLVLDGLEWLSSKFAIRLMVGPLFPGDLVLELDARAAASRHSIELVHAPQGLAKYMLWSDVAIAASGLTKYELAATSTPAILMSMDRAHDVVNRPFVSAGTAWDLGTSFDARSIADAAEKLLGDQVARSSMASAGSKLIDGRGANRLISLIMRTYCATK